MAHVRASAMGAVGCLNSFNSENVKNMSEFFGGIYGFAENFSGSEAERKAAVELSGYAEGIYYHLNDIASAVMGGAYSLTEYGSPYSKEEAPYFEDYIDYSNGSEAEIFELASPAAALTGGDFLSEKPKISKEDACGRASGIIAINSALWRVTESVYEGTEVYALKHGNVEVDVCRVSGAVCRLINPMPCAEVLYSADDARQKATDFLENQGYYNMVMLSGEQSEFAARFAFVPEVNGILNLIAYIEISVCLASGAITDFDASEYIKNSRSDLNFAFGNPDLTDFLARGLAVEKVLPCFAQTDGRQRFIYLAVCNFESSEVWVYIDASSFEVLKTEVK